MSRNNWCVLALVSIAFVTLATAVVLGIFVDNPRSSMLLIGAIGLMFEIAVSVYAAVEFSNRAHEEPTAVVPAPVVDPVVAPPPPPDQPVHGVAHQAAHMHCGLIIGIAVAAVLILAVVGVGGWFLYAEANTIRLDPAGIASLADSMLTKRGY